MAGANFDWFKGLFTTKNTSKSRKEVTRQVRRDLRENYVSNTGLTYGLYHNSYEGLKLAGGLAFPAIAIPVYFMGFPVVTVDTEDEDLKELVKSITERYTTMVQMINTETHRDGTVWVWPRFDSEVGEVVWEIIQDETVSDVVRSLDNATLLAVYTDEEITVTVGRQLEETVLRKRAWTRDVYTDQYDGAALTADRLESSERVNRTGLLPIPFSNNRGSQEIRGHSDLERILPQLASYHEIWQNMLETIAKFRTKMIQSGVKDVETWLSNNAIEPDFSNLDIGAIDFLINTEGESTNFIFATGATSEHREALKMLFHQMVEASGIPELVWGLKTEGNHASAEENMATLAMFIADKQRQKTAAYRKLFQATIELEMAAALDTRELGDIKVEWNNLDAVSEKVRSEIFSSFATGLSALMKSAAITKEQAWRFWQASYPSITENDFDAWVLGVNETAALNQFNTASWSETAGSNL